MSRLPLQRWLATDQEKSDFSVPDARAFRKDPTELILIMTRAQSLPNSDEVTVMRSCADMVSYKRGPRCWWPHLVSRALSLAISYALTLSLREKGKEMVMMPSRLSWVLSLGI